MSQKLKRLFISSLLLTTTMLHFANGNWLQVTVPSTRNYVSAEWYNDTVVRMVGTDAVGNSIIVKSVNAGVMISSEFSWAASSGYGSAYDIDSTTISSVVNSLVVTDAGYVFRSTAGAGNWAIAAQIPVPIYGVSIGTNGNAFAVGNINGIYQATSTTSFATWTRYSLLIASRPRFNAVTTINGVNAIVVGVGGHIYYTSDSGSSWTKGTISSTNTLNCVSTASSDSSIAMVGGTNSLVAVTTDGGISWTIRSVFTATNVNIRFHSIAMLTDTVAFVAGSNGRIFKTVDRGVTWILEEQTQVTLYCIEMRTEIIGIAGAIAGSGAYIRTDGM